MFNYKLTSIEGDRNEGGGMARSTTVRDKQRQTGGGGGEGFRKQLNLMGEQIIFYSSNFFLGGSALIEISIYLNISHTQSVSRVI